MSLEKPQGLIQQVFTRKTIIGVCTALAVSIICYELLFSLKIILIETPTEYRETVMLTTTGFLVDGDNPYSFDKLPVYTNAYGILSHIVVYPFAKMFGNSFLVHRAASAIFALASCGIIVMVLHWQGLPRYLKICAISLFLYNMIRANSISAYPAAQGQFLLLCSLIIPWRFKFSNTALIFSAILSILALLTKPYFFLGLPVVAVYLFIAISKKRAIAFLFFSSALLLFTILVVNSLLPSYFVNTFYLHLQNTTDSLPHLIRQLKYYFIKMLALNIFLISMIISKLICLKQRFVEKPGKTNIAHFQNLFDIKHLSKPFLNVTVGFFPLVLILTIAVLLKMGQHVGRSFGYFGELLAPSLLIVVLPHMYNSLKTSRGTALLLLLNLLIILFSLPALPKAHRQTWAEWEAIISKHEHVYACAPLAYILQKQGKKVYEAGQAVFFSTAVARSHESFSTKTQNIVRQYCEDLRTKVQSQYFDLIITDAKSMPFWSKNEIEKFYVAIQQKDLYMPKKVKLQLWKLK